MAASSMERAIKSVFDRYFPLNEMKSHQMEVISHIMNKKDVFCLLPTGYGKSMTFIMVPLLLNELNPEKKHTAVVISPLKALMADQAEQLRQKGIKTAVLVETTQLNDVKDSDPSIIFASPEAAILPKWTRILREHLQKRICLLAFDEAHCISSWGLDFRPSYRQVAVLQSYFDVPTLVLTATATRKIQDDIFSVLGLHHSDTEVVATLPNRANIYLQMQESTENFETELCWILEHLQKSEKKKKMIIYVRSINLCYRIFLFLTTGLMDSNYFKPGMVEMFHANTDKETKEHIMKEFVQEGGEICVLVSTVAFGMGVNIPDVDIVVHWGLPSSGLAYWQEVGRCGRDGRCSYAICYAYKRSISKCEDEHLKKAVGLDTCLRISVLKHFQLQGTNNASLTQLEKDSASECSKNECVKSLCCSVCHNMCCCNNKDNNMLKTFLSS